MRHIAKTCNAGAGQPLWQSMDWHLSEDARWQIGSAAIKVPQVAIAWALS